MGLPITYVFVSVSWDCEPAAPNAVDWITVGPRLAGLGLVYAVDAGSGQRAVRGVPDGGTCRTSECDILRSP